MYFTVAIFQFSNKNLIEFGSTANSTTKQIPVIDLSKDYPDKSIKTNEIFSANYIQLETKPGFLFDGRIVTIQENFILCFNKKNGDILIFDNKGKVIRKINHLGNSSQEYKSIFDITYDNSNEEIYIDCVRSRRIFVYKLSGEYIRSFKFIEGKLYTKIISTSNGLLCCDDSEMNNSNSFFLISSKDGSLIKEIKIGFKKKLRSGRMTENAGYLSYPYPQMYKTLDGIILNEISSDTIFLFTNEMKKIPQLISRNRVTETNKIYVLYSLFKTQNYHFLVYNCFDFNPNTQKNNPKFTIYAIDNKTNEIFIPKFDETNGIKFALSLNQSSIEPGVIVQILNSYLLVDLNKKQKLDFELQKIAANLNENDNPVLRIITFKD